MAKIGEVGWIDMAVPNAEAVRDFYQKVVGWTSSELTVGDHQDYCMHPSAGSDPVTGICHALGQNAGLPPVWIIHITVADLDESVRQCLALGGKVLKGPSSAGSYGRYCIIQDPAGATAGLFENAK
jgi:predicted enzyme related to lactoylglutathione lyase